MREWFSYLSPKQQMVKILLTYTAIFAISCVLTSMIWPFFNAIQIVSQSAYPFFTVGLAFMISICHYNKKAVYKILLVLFLIVPFIPLLPLMMLALVFSSDNPYASTLSHFTLALTCWLAILTPLIVPLVLSFFDWKRLLVKLHLSKTKA
ncbi:hypothetical protein [Aeromonas media]|uniref:hypothetical protein n=1 Tax=Aeromonas media TaxID=651 RepID=UPI003D206C26